MKTSKNYKNNALRRNTIIRPISNQVNNDRICFHFLFNLIQSKK